MSVGEKKVYYVCEGTAKSLRKVLDSRGWTEYKEGKHKSVDLYWKVKRHTIAELADFRRHPIINHFRRTQAMTLKDRLLRNISRMQRNWDKMYNFFPKTYLIPNNWKDVEEDEKDLEKKSLWITKPTDSRRGLGISVHESLSTVHRKRAAILQKYVDNPLLIDGYKSDLRLYVFIPSFHPLKIFVMRNGLVRFSSERYDMSNLKNNYSHLTNSSINRHNPDKEKEKSFIGESCKWTVERLLVYLKEHFGLESDRFWRMIDDVVILTVLSIIDQIPESEHSFEMFGFDIMLDEKLKPWLLEVNASPAIATKCREDEVVKIPLLHELIDNVFGPSEVEVEREGGDTKWLEQAFPFDAQSEQACSLLDEEVRKKENISRSIALSETRKISIEAIRKRRRASRRQTKET